MDSNTTSLGNLTAMTEEALFPALLSAESSTTDTALLTAEKATDNSDRVYQDSIDMLIQLKNVL